MPTVRPSKGLLFFANEQDARREKDHRKGSWMLMKRRIRDFVLPRVRKYIQYDILVYIYFVFVMCRAYLDINVYINVYIHTSMYTYRALYTGIVLACLFRCRRPSLPEFSLNGFLILFACVCVCFFVNQNRMPGRAPLDGGSQGSAAAWPPSRLRGGAKGKRHHHCRL